MSFGNIATLIGLIAIIMSSEIDDKLKFLEIGRKAPTLSNEQRTNPQKTPLTNTRNESEPATSTVLDILPTRNFSTAVGTIHTLARAIGKPESEAKLQGVFGHAFSFEMKEGAGDVWQEENLDYKGLFLKMTSKLGYRLQRFEAKQRDNQGDFKNLKIDAWNAVQASINQGVPAIAWQPMSRAQKSAGLRAGAWGLLVGFNRSDETYTVRHQYHKKGKETYTVRFDEIGHTDPIEWFHVLVYDGSVPVDT